ncbi:hypothetical protein Vretimale_14912 [Volvox reticuliferus]|uniref:Uncharacterized protein n=1 Tax=Volvox reticuliferus TaxID=1737510 RepID=A0A8J4CZI3_9CHLO|nr:hypothetical protein Vretifemale_19575 [Volvox reticuliferus]GIM11436.1 hypothetical protein Vretimale_14912 [Volvox reticuliferus]
MESVGRMTRSKARALGATPMSAIPSKPEPKTTGRRRRAAAQVQEPSTEEATPRQLHFPEEPPVQQQVPADAHPQPEPKPLPNADENKAISGRAEEATIVEGGPGFPRPVAGSPVSLAMRSPIYSPLPTAASPLPMDASPFASFASHLPPGTNPFPIVMSPMPMAASPLPVAMEASPMVGVLQHLNPEGAAPSPAPGVVEGSPMATRTPLSFTSDAPRNGVLAAAQPLAASIPASPLSLTAEAIDEAIFSPMPEDDALDSPISLSGAAELTPQLTPPLMPQLAHHGLEVEDLEEVGDVDEMMAEATPVAGDTGVGAMAGSPLTFVSDRRAATPASAPSPAASFAGVPPDSVPHASASPAPLVSSFQGFAAVFPTPSGFALEPNSPSLAGLMSVSAPSPSMVLLSAGPTATDPTIPTPSTIASENDPAAAPVTATSAAVLTSTSSTAATVVTPTFGANTDAGSSMVTADAQRTSDNSSFSPVIGACLPPAPAPTPESGVLPGWTLAQTPLVNALAVSVSDEAVDQCDYGEENECDGEMDKVGHDSEVKPAGFALDGSSSVHDVEMDEGLQPPQTTTLAALDVAPGAATPQQAPNVAGSSVSVAKHASLQGRGPAVGSVFRTASATPIGKIATKAGTPARSSYITVESRYNKTPTTGSTAARPRPSIATVGAGVASSTPVANTHAAHGAKSMKRVSIHTPEGPRSVAPHRQVVPTPFRPKSASQPSVVPAAEEVLAEKPAAAVDQLQAQPHSSQASAAAEERRAKAAERLRAIHASEQGPVSGPAPAPAARLSSGPGYLAPTQAFAVKSSVKVPKNKADAANCDPRSLRQLKRDVRDAVARKEAKAALTEARSSKLTPKVHERQLPMPDDDEGSDDQAEYNEGQENDLVAAMTGLAVAPSKAAPVPLRGVPAPQGRHIRFDDKGKVSESPQRTVLRGLPVAIGKYKRFD